MAGDPRGECDAESQRRSLPEEDVDPDVPELSEKRLPVGGTHATHDLERQRREMVFRALEPEFCQTPEQPSLGGRRTPAEEALHPDLTG